jgi:hypothetical protein
MTRYRNRITGDDCRMTGEVTPLGLVGVKYEDDERTFFISPGRLVLVCDLLGEQVERELRRTIELQGPQERPALPAFGLNRLRRFRRVASLSQGNPHERGC